MTNVSVRKEPIHSRTELLAPEPAPTRAQQWAEAARRQRWLIAAALIPIFLVWLIPILIAHTSLMNSVLASAGADLEGTVTAKSASLGWFSPIWLEGVEVRDEHDRVVTEIPEVAGDRSLLSLLCNSTKLGRFRLREPKFHVVLREGGSNLEDLLANYLSGKPSTPLDVDVQVVNGSISLGDSRSTRAWQIDKLDVSLRKPLDGAKPIEVSVSGSFPDTKPAGQFALDLRMSQSAGKEASLGPADVSVKTEGLPLAMLEAILGRLSLKASLGGKLSSAIQCHWNTPESPERLTVQSSVEANGFTLSAAALGSDRLDLQTVRANCQLQWQDGRLQVDQFAAESDVGNTSLAGVFQWDDASKQSLLEALRRQSYEVRGQVDLTRLAKMLPNTLCIRKGTQIASGQMSLRMASQRGPEGMVWQGRFETTNLTAVNDARRLVWEQPLLITLSAHESSQGPILESLRCESSFLKVSVSGTRDQLTASTTFDLNRLVAQLNGFVDLGAVRLAGDGWSNFTWKRSKQQGGFEADADLQVRSFQLALPNRPAWMEDNLTAMLSATGRTDFSASSRLDEAVVKLDAGPDHLEARLLQPVVGFQRGGIWAVDLRAQGQIARWMPRIGVWTTLADWRAGGTYDVQGQATYSPDDVRFSRVRLSIGQFDLVGPWLNVREPVLELLLSGRFVQGARRLEAEQVSLMTNNVALQAGNLVAAWPAQGAPELSGTMACQGSLEQVQQWFAAGNAPRNWQIGGQLVGKAEFRQAAGAIAGRFDAAVNNLVAAHSSGRKFQEALVRLEGRGSYKEQSRTLEVERVKLTSGTLGGTVSGRIASSSHVGAQPPGPANDSQPAARLADPQTGAAASDVQLAGQLDYDMEKLSQLIQSYTGGVVHINGRGSSPVSYRGPLSLDQSQASAAVKWNWGELYGFRVEAGELQAALNGGTLQVRPAELQVSEGRLYLAPQIRLNATPVELVLPPGKLIEQVRINPMMCAAALQYVAPVLAGITNIEGRFSVELQDCRVPLGNPSQSEIAGRMILHSAQVGAGPLIQELVVLLGRASPAQLNRESALEFRMVEGRIYHRGLELAFPDLTIRTYGSVGLDQSLAMVAELPVPPKWKENQLLAATLKDQVLRLPIGGTLQKPKLDRTILDQISRQFLQNSARNVIDNALNGQLDRLFPQQQPGNAQRQPQANPQQQPNR